jgi:hypothetical protein
MPSKNGSNDNGKLDLPVFDGPACPNCGSFLILPDGTCAACGEGVPQQLVHEPEIVVPDNAEPVSGWRAWELDIETFGPEKPVLRSPSHEMIWMPRQEVEARCDKFGKFTPQGTGANHGHVPPVSNCSCGLYAARTYEHLMTMSYHAYGEDTPFRVVGEVAMWGGLIPATLGWRGQKAYPTRLFLPFEAWKYGRALKQMYGVKVNLRNTLGEKLEKVE